MYIVSLEGKNENYLSGFSDNTFWPTSSRFLSDAKVFDDLTTAKYAAELCEEKLNDAYSPRVLQIQIKVEQPVD